MVKDDKIKLVLPDIDLEAILEFSPGYIYWKNLDSVYSGCNQNLIKLLSFKNYADIVGRSEYEMPWTELNPTISEHNIKADRYVIETGQTWVTEEELGIKNEEGLSIVLRSEKRPLKDKQGKIVGVLGVSLDITKQKESENPLTDISLIIDSFPGYVYWKDLNSVYQRCNQTFAILAGFQAADEMIGKTDYDLVDAEIADKYVSDDQYVIKTGKVLVAEDRTGIKNSKGLEIIVRTEKKPFFDKKGTVLGVLGVAVDITDEKDLKGSEIDQDFILNSTPGYVYWKNLDSVYIGCNQDFLQIALSDNVNDVLGKTDFTLPWGVSDPAIATKFVNDDRYVITTGNSIVAEDNLVIKNSRGLTVIVRTEKKPLYDKKGNIIGVLGIAVDVTDQKEAERLQFESETQKIAIQEKEKFITLARKVAHDINSPLAALKMMLEVCDELPENKRTILNKATEGILDIANNLLSCYNKEKNSTTSEIEARQPLLVSDLLIQLLSEKKVQYRNRPIVFDTVVTNAAQFAFINMQVSQFRRSISNLINNAVDAVAAKKKGVIIIQLTADANMVVVEIQDNGKGMTSNLIEKMLDRQSFTEGKEGGHGLGLLQVWDTLEYNQGTMEVQSSLGKGTSIQLSFPRTEASNWIAQDIHLIPDNIIVILDDDESIHTAWNLRFASFLTSYPTLRMRHFTQGQEVLDFLATLSPEEKNYVIFLSDYELLHQRMNGLQIIEASEIKRSILVTSYYSNPKVREATAQLGITVLPKQMASIIPIYFDPD